MIRFETATNLLISLSVAALIGCSGEDSGGRPTTNNNSTAGTTSTAGTSSSSGGGGGTGGTASAGTGGATGGTGTGGATAMTPFDCMGFTPTSTDITDFATIDAMNHWGDVDTFGGGIFTYPAAAITYDASAGTLAVSGEVADYSGFGIWFAPCTDASAYTGLSFDLSGDFGEAGKVTVALQTNGDSPIDVASSKGACTYTSETAKYSECVVPTHVVDVPSGGGTVSVTWADFAMGKPTATADPTQIIGLQFAFTWAAMDAAYNVDVTLDNVKFTE